MRDKNGKILKIGDAVRCKDGGYSFDPSEGIVVNDNGRIKLYKCNPDNIDTHWNQKYGWNYNSKHLTKISRENYLMSKLKE